MKKMVRNILLTVLCTTLTVALGACAGNKEEKDSSTGSNASQTETTASVDSSIVIGIPQDIEDSLDPHVATGAGTREVLFNLFEGLVKPDSDGNLNPAVASAYQISDDGKTYTFTLRDGILFHDGSAVTVEDVKYSLERSADTGMVPALSDITSIEIPDEHTVVIRLAEQNPDFLTYLTTAIIPEDNTNPETNPIGTGPYRYVSRSPQENIVMEKFDGYWGEPAHIQDVTFQVCADSASLVVDMEAGAIDMFARVTSAQAAQLSDKFNIEEGTMNLVQALYLNNDNEYFSNPLVRQALCYAVDRQAILDFVSDGKGVIIGSSMFPAFGKYYMEELADVYEQNIDKAKELLAEAGYPDGFSFTISVPSNYQQHIDTAQVIKEQLKAIHVDAQIDLIEWDSWLSDVYTDRNYDATVIGVDASSLTARALLERFTSTASNNFINYHNEDYDAAFANAIGTVDEEKQTEYYKECERILAEDAANVYIQDIVEYVALNKKYAGYEFYPLYVQDVAKLYIVE